MFANSDNDFKETSVLNNNLLFITQNDNTHMKGLKLLDRQVSCRVKKAQK